MERFITMNIQLLFNIFINIQKTSVIIILPQISNLSTTINVIVIFFF